MSEHPGHFRLATSSRRRVAVRACERPRARTRVRATRETAAAAPSADDAARRLLETNPPADKAARAWPASRGTRFKSPTERRLLRDQAIRSACSCARRSPPACEPAGRPSGSATSMATRPLASAGSTGGLRYCRQGGRPVRRPDHRGAGRNIETHTSGHTERRADHRHGTARSSTRSVAPEHRRIAGALCKNDCGLGM